LAVKVGEVAAPEELVTAVTLAAVPKAPLAPEPGAVNVTVAPLTGLPLESFTVADSGEEKAVFTGAVCGVPPVAVIDAAGLGAFVSENDAGLATPDTIAETL
jgi:hypothetical protein